MRKYRIVKGDRLRSEWFVEKRVFFFWWVRDAWTWYREDYAKNRAEALKNNDSLGSYGKAVNKISFSELVYSSCLILISCFILSIVVHSLKKVKDNPEKIENIFYNNCGAPNKKEKKGKTFKVNIKYTGWAYSD
jgi:hypothetical protein